MSPALSQSIPLAWPKLKPPLEPTSAQYEDWRALNQKALQRPRLLERHSTDWILTREQTGDNEWEKLKMQPWWSGWFPALQAGQADPVEMFSVGYRRGRQTCWGPGHRGYKWGPFLHFLFSSFFVGPFGLEALDNQVCCPPLSTALVTRRGRHNDLGCFFLQLNNGASGGARRQTALNLLKGTFLVIQYSLITVNSYLPQRNNYCVLVTECYTTFC